MINKIVQIWKIKDLRKNILFVLGMLVIFRFASHIPIPGVDVKALGNFFNSNQVLGLLNVFSGGSMANFSVVMMGIAPYITSSIIFQLLGMIIPQLDEMQKEESGRQKINMWTRWATVPLAALQAFSMVILLERSNTGILNNASPFDIFSMVLTITAGTIFLMWIGELITEKNIGNGISLLIFAGIVARLPQSMQQIVVNFDPSQMTTVIGFAIIAVITVVGVVWISEGERNVPVQYAKQVRGNRSFGGTTTHLPLRVNMAGVIPIIFAISVVLFPSMVAQFFVKAKTAWIANFSQWIIDILANQLIYGILYFILVFAFTYFYTEIIFHPDQIAENLQKQGGFIPGIRPGRHTSEYLASTTHRIIFIGALFLGSIAVLPLVLRYFSGGTVGLTIGGTSLLIVVAVVIETVKQIEAQLTMREYEGL